MTFSAYLVKQGNVFERSYPAHPTIQEMRTKIINKSCFSYPSIVKNEIEFLHMKMCMLELEKQRKLLNDPDLSMDDLDTATTVLEREFKIGDTSKDYKQMIA